MTKRTHFLPKDVDTFLQTVASGNLKQAAEQLNFTFLLPGAGDHDPIQFENLLSYVARTNHPETDNLFSSADKSLPLKKIRAQKMVRPGETENNVLVVALENDREALLTRVFRTLSKNTNPTHGFVSELMLSTHHQQTSPGQWAKLPLTYTMIRYASLDILTLYIKTALTLRAPWQQGGMDQGMIQALLDRNTGSDKPSFDAVYDRLTETEQRKFLGTRVRVSLNRRGTVRIADIRSAYEQAHIAVDPDELDRRRAEELRTPTPKPRRSPLVDLYGEEPEPPAPKIQPCTPPVILGSQPASQAGICSPQGIIGLSSSILCLLSTGFALHVGIPLFNEGLSFIAMLHHVKLALYAGAAAFFCLLALACCVTAIAKSCCRPQAPSLLSQRKWKLTPKDIQRVQAPPLEL